MSSRHTGRNLGRIWPGLALAVLVAASARALHGILPARAAALVGEVILAVGLGLVLGNTFRPGGRFQPGLRVAYQGVLRLAIVLLGARFAFDQVLAIGGRALVLILALMTLALVVAHTLGHWAGVSRKLASLIGVGAAVCGNSAITAVAPVIEARDEDMSYAIATNTVFGTVAVFLYPLLGHALGLDDAFFGTWAGTAVNDTSQVVATGFAYSETAGDIATTVKLTRNALMGLVILGMGLAYGGALGRSGLPLRSRVARSVPLFVVGFLVMALLNTLGVFRELSMKWDRDLGADLGACSHALILVALAGVGLGTRLVDLRRTGWRPFVVGFVTACTMALASYALIHGWGPAGQGP